MREAIGEALLLQLILTILIVIMIIFVSSISYSKAFKLKNRIINIIEEKGSYAPHGGDAAYDEITDLLSDIGYQITKGTPKCNNDKKDGAVKLYPSGGGSGYNYCVVKYQDSNGRTYYGVTTFMNFEFPIIGKWLEFPVYGETKTFGILE